MGQVNWRYKDASGKLYDINLYHGDESGHVLIYVNESILVIDFAIFSSKNYTFYINEKLFSLSLNPQAGIFDYVLELEGTRMQNERINVDDAYKIARFREKILGVIMVLTVLSFAFAVFRFLLNKSF